MIETGTTNRVVYYENGEEVYPCHCGETHRGAYAVYDWGQHNCFHEDSLIPLDDSAPGYLICGLCGQTFRVRDHTASEREEGYHKGLLAGLEAALPFVRDKNRHQVFDLLDYIREHGELPGGDDA